ncbi:hypothetical protein I3843_08G055000 [Carya illinoinensis]|nr:hypothetical protein I3843_08G055000 [Carya illinoinensis]
MLNILYLCSNIPTLLYFCYCCIAPLPCDLRCNTELNGHQPGSTWPMVHAYAGLSFSCVGQEYRTLEPEHAELVDQIAEHYLKNTTTSIKVTGNL